MGPLLRSCVEVREPIELSFGVYSLPNLQTSERKYILVHSELDYISVLLFLSYSELFVTYPTYIWRRR